MQENLMLAIKAVKDIPYPLIDQWRAEWASNVWRIHTSRSNGKTYYHNLKTEKSQWNKPRSRNEWGAYYYVHKRTGMAQWKTPEMLFQYYPRAPVTLMYNPSQKKHQFHGF